MSSFDIIVGPLGCLLQLFAIDSSRIIKCSQLPFVPPLALQQAQAILHRLQFSPLDSLEITSDTTLTSKVTPEEIFGRFVTLLTTSIYGKSKYCNIMTCKTRYITKYATNSPISINYYLLYLLYNVPHTSYHKVVYECVNFTLLDIVY